VSVSGTVRSWDDEHGVGVVDSDATPGGCWTHHSHIAMGAHRSLQAGQRVELEWESPGQDGYPFRAVRVWAEGTEPVEPPVVRSPSSAYRSVLTLWFDEDHRQA
jgi:cold shock protein